MKVGSLVECIIGYTSCKAKFPNVNVPLKGNHYHVRGFISPTHEEINYFGLTSSVYIYLDEIKNTAVKDNFSNIVREPGFQIRSFREIQLPDSLEAEIKEMLTQPILIPA